VVGAVGTGVGKEEQMRIMTTIMDTRTKHETLHDHTKHETLHDHTKHETLHDHSQGPAHVNLGRAAGPGC
jgi:hypothetical protein